MQRLPLFLALIWGCVSLDLNDGMMKKYAFMKIMSGCLGEDFVMMIKQQMVKACAECQGRDMNMTQQHNFDYLMNHFRNSQNSIPMIPPTQNIPLVMYQPFIYPIFIGDPHNAHPSPHFQGQQPIQGQQPFQGQQTFQGQQPQHHHDQHQYNTFPHHHAADEFRASPQFPSQHPQHQFPHQHTSFPHQHAAADFNTFPHYDGHYQDPTVHQHNVPNIRYEHYTSNFPQYDLNNPQNFHGIANGHNLNNNIKEHGHTNVDQLNIQAHLTTHSDTQNPFLASAQLRSPIPNNQLGYPEKNHHERQFYQLNPQPVDPESRKKRSLPLTPENLETLKMTLTSKIENMTCVFREMGWLTEENDVNFTFIEQQIKNLNLNMKLQDDLVYSHDICKDFSMCMPTEKAKHPLVREIGEAMSYMKCMCMKTVNACMKNDFRMYQAKMGYGSEEDGLPMEIDNMLKTQNSDPSQLVDDIGSFMFTATSQMIF